MWTDTDQCRLIGEEVSERDPSKAGMVKLDPADVVTAEQAGRQLAP